ncbi:hypothetical protein [Nocardiopsis algeriensis]|uniref:Uncharacterized protein n=1 Tax=Nocardiopsis algeriensis TaxID=1478215 RepID=A0A841IU63_9ACTN|nr:hypothetical protein [Nocardiopsis algeriensis]MBB6121780.1 hypothetical protein [Nocardiopsis algeriensis]
MYENEPAGRPAVPLLPPGLQFPYAIHRPAPREPTGPGAPPARSAPRAVYRIPRRPRVHAADAVAAAFLAGEPMPRPRARSGTWF